MAPPRKGTRGPTVIIISRILKAVSPFSAPFLTPESMGGDDKVMLKELVVDAQLPEEKEKKCRNPLDALITVFREDHPNPLSNPAHFDL